MAGVFLYTRTASVWIKALQKMQGVNWSVPGNGWQSMSWISAKYWKGGERVGRPRKIESPDMLYDLWEEFKNDCDNQNVLTHEFSAKAGKYVSQELKRCITYTIEGFCVYIGLARRAFYDTYANSEEYSHIVTHMREECEYDARRKFEIQAIPSQLAGLWMSKHGYSTKVENDMKVQTSQKLDDIMSQMGGEGLGDE